MSLLRVAWLISLMLVVNTLPASALSLPTASEEEDSSSSNPNTKTSGETDEENDDESSAIRINPNTDVWNGSTTRAANTCTASAPVASFLGGDLGARLPQVDPNSFARIEAPIPGKHSQHCWLTCRYAHAPPAGV